MMPRHDTITLTTSTAGAFSVTRNNPGANLLHVVYADDGTLATTADLTITDANTGMTLYSKSNFGATAGFSATPRQEVTLYDGSAGATAAADRDYAPSAVTGRYTLTIAQGGTSKDATIHLVFGD